MISDQSSGLSQMNGPGQGAPSRASEGGTGGKNRFLAALPPDLLGEITPQLREKRLETGRLLHEAGDAVEEICFPLSGVISLQELLPEGDALQVAVIGADGAIGLHAGLGSARAVNRAVVQVPGRGAFIAARTFASIAARSEALGSAVVEFTNALLAQVQRTAACNVRHSAEARVCRWLLQSLDAAQGGAVEVTQEAIGDLLGIRRTTVTLIAQALQKQGAIQYRRGSITLRDREALRGLACACYERAPGKGSQSSRTGP